MVIMKEKINLFSILHAGKTNLIKICQELKLSTHGNEAQLQERIIRHIFPVDKSPGEKEPEFIGKLNINTAKVDQFLLWPYIGKTTVDNIMEYRQKYGRFHSVEELLNVKGIGIKTFGLLRKFLSTTGSTTLRIRRDGEEIEEYLKIREIGEAIRKREHELKDWEDAIESDHEEIEEQQLEIRKEQEELMAKEMSIIEKEKEIGKLKDKLSEKEKSIEQLKKRMEKTYGDIEVGNLIPKKKVQETVTAFKKHEEEMSSSYKKLLASYNDTKEELVCLIGENEELRKSLEKVITKQAQITKIQDELKKTYEVNIIEQKELLAQQRKLGRLEKRLLKQDAAIRAKEGRLKAQLRTLRKEKTGLAKETRAALRKMEREKNILARQKKRLDSLLAAYNKKIGLTGTININKASREEMRLWPHLSDKVIQNIIAYRKKYGGFRRLDEIKEVDGIGEESYRLLLPFVRLSGETTLRIQLGKETSLAIDDFIHLEAEIAEKKKKLILRGDELEIQHAEQDELASRQNKELAARAEELALQKAIYDKDLVLYGRFNINHSSKEELALWPYISQEIAENIVAYREKYKGFKTPEELMNVKGIAKGIYTTLAPFITLTGPSGIEIRKRFELTDAFGELESERGKFQGLLKRLHQDQRELARERSAIRRSADREEQRLARQKAELEALFDAYHRKIGLSGRININKASRDEMRPWPYLSDMVITNILAYRKKYGRFRRLDELKEVDGIGEETYKILLPFLSLSGDTGLRIVLDTEVSSAIEDLIRIEDELEKQQKDLRFRTDELENSFAQKENELEASVKKREKDFREYYDRKENELLEKIKAKEQSLVKQFRERQLQLEEKYKDQFSSLQREKGAFGEEREKLIKEYEKQKKELDAKADELFLKEGIYDKNLVVVGRININRASAEELALWPHITPIIARGIIAYRTKYNGFKRPEELMNVKGIAHETYTTLAPFITLKGATGIELRKLDRLSTAFRDLEHERQELEDMKRSLMERRDALSELYEEKEAEEIKLRNLQKEYSERKQAIDEIYEERLRLREEADLEKKGYIKKKEELDVIYRERIADKEREYGEREEELKAGFQERRAELEEEYSEKHGEMEAEFSEKENYYTYRMEELAKHRDKVIEREEIQDRGAILFGRINLNKATKGELLLWPHITPAIARNVIAYREKYGSFNDVDELKSVKGIGEESFQLLRPFVDVKGATGLRINEGFNADTIIDDLEEQKQGMLEQKHDYNVRKRELEWEYQECFGSTKRALKKRDKELTEEKQRFAEGMENEHAKLQAREDSLKEMKKDLKRYERKLKRRATKLDKIDDKLTERETVQEKNATLFAKLNLNTASKEELLFWPHITPALADRIIAYRKKRRFRRVEELKEIKGIGEESYQELRPFLATRGKTGLKLTVGDEVYTVLDDLEGRKQEMITAKTEYHREKRELRDDYHEKVETGLREIEKGQKKLKGDRRTCNKRERELKEKQKELGVREEKVKEDEEIAELNAELIGKININTATLEELVQWPHISTKIAKGIIAYREKFDGFKKLEEFKDVKGIGDETFKLLRPFIVLSGTTGFTINPRHRRARELWEMEEHVSKAAEGFQKKSELLEENLQDILQLRDTVDEDQLVLKENMSEIETLKGRVVEKYERMEELKQKMEDMHDTMGKLLTGGKLEGISVRSLLPKEELEAFEQEKETLAKRMDNLNELQEEMANEREQLGFAAGRRVAIPLEIEIGDEPIEHDKIIVKEEKGDFVKEVVLTDHGKRIDANLYSVVLPEIPAGRRYTIIHDTGDGKQYVVVRNYPAKVVE